MTWLWSIVFGMIGLALGAGLNPVITYLATDPKAANPLGTPRHPLLGAPTWLGNHGPDECGSLRPARVALEARVLDRHLSRFGRRGGHGLESTAD